MASLGTDGDWLRGPASSHFPWVTGRRALALALARALEQRPNVLPYWRGYGIALTDLIESNVPPAQIKMLVERQFERQERVVAAIVTPSLVDGSLTLTCVVDDGDGPFEFVLSAADAAVKLLSLQGKAVEDNG